jgi:prepilin-type N-terminal cleavage/methylation domain-containing protein
MRWGGFRPAELCDPIRRNTPTRIGIRDGNRGFSLIELLTTVAILTILASLLLVSLVRAKKKAQAILCLNNHKQLALAWLLYAGENDDRLVYNLGGKPKGRSLAPREDYNWINNFMDWELSPDNTNTTFTTKARLSPYSANSVTIYRCPSDHALSDLQRRAHWNRRVRSVSMNAMVGDAGDAMQGGANMNNPEYQQFLRLSDFQQPVGTFVFLDEHPDSINDGYFLNKPDDNQWIDLPASYHNGSGSLSFADGHFEFHHWRDPKTEPPPRADVISLPCSVPKSQRADFDWLMERTSVEQ